MPIVGAIVVLIQFCFAYHVLKTGRPYWWVFIIMAFPAMGCVIYYFVEVFPGSRGERRAARAVRAIARALEPDAALKRRAEELELCGSVDNKLALAEECMHHAMYAEAIKLYESCLAGAYANDAAILYGLARAALEAREWPKALATLERLKKAAPKMRADDIGLLEARLDEGRGAYDSALARYRQLLPQFVGLEARYRYARLLQRLGKTEAALELFNQVVKQAKRHGSAIEEEERWAEAAREAIAGH
ncbi:MAG: tetratricopeptide repeat protein [Burkholderiales bacterium]